MKRRSGVTLLALLSLIIGVSTPATWATRAQEPVTDDLWVITQWHIANHGVCSEKKVNLTGLHWGPAPCDIWGAVWVQCKKKYVWGWWKKGTYVWYKIVDGRFCIRRAPGCLNLAKGEVDLCQEVKVPPSPVQVVKKYELYGFLFVADEVEKPKPDVCDEPPCPTPKKEWIDLPVGRVAPVASPEIAVGTITTSRSPFLRVSAFAATAPRQRVVEKKVIVIKQQPPVPWPYKPGSGPTGGYAPPITIKPHSPTQQGGSVVGIIPPSGVIPPKGYGE